MADAALIAIAKAVADDLNAYDMGAGIAFAAEWSFADWSMKLDDSDKSTRVDVVPIDYTGAVKSDRKGLKYECSIHIGVRKMFDSPDIEQRGRLDKNEVAKHVLLVERIHEFFQGRVLTTAPDSQWSETRIVQAGGAGPSGSLALYGMFVGLVQVTFWVWKQPATFAARA